MRPSTHRLVLKGELSEVRSACAFVVEIAKEAGLDEKSVYWCELCVEEVFTNIVEHGYHYEGADKRIVIDVEIQPGKLSVIFIDDAPQFNPVNFKDKDPTSLLDRKAGGWGLYFVQQFMDDISYSYVDQQNRLVIEKRLP